MGEVVPARTSPTLNPPSPPTVHQLSRLALKELIGTFYNSMQSIDPFGVLKPGELVLPAPLLCGRVPVPDLHP